MKTESKQKSGLRKGAKIIWGIIGGIGIITAAIIGCIDLIQFIFPAPSVPQEVIVVGGAVPAAVERESAYQGETYVQPTQPLSLSVSGYELDSEGLYCVMDSTPIMIEAVQDQQVKHILYQIGANDVVKLKNTSSAEIRIPADKVGKKWFTLNVCAELRDGSRSAWKAYRMSLCTPEEYENAPLILCTSGTVLDSENTYLLSKEQSLCLQAAGGGAVTEVQYRFGTGPLVRCEFRGYLELTPPAELADTGSFSLNVGGFDGDGQAIPWRQYHIETTAEEEFVPPLSVSLNGAALEEGQYQNVGTDAAITISIPHASDNCDIYYKIGTEDTVCIPNRSSAEIYLPSKIRGTGAFSLNVCYVTANGAVSPWQCYKLVMD